MLVFKIRDEKLLNLCKTKRELFTNELRTVFGKFYGLERHWVYVQKCRQIEKC